MIYEYWATMFIIYNTYSKRWLTCNIKNKSNEQEQDKTMMKDGEGFENPEGAFARFVHLSLSFSCAWHKPLSFPCAVHDIYKLCTLTLFRELIPNESAEDLRARGIRDNTTIVTFSIKFYYTIDFAEATDDIDLYMNQVHSIQWIHIRKM